MSTSNLLKRVLHLKHNSLINFLYHHLITLTQDNSLGTQHNAQDTFTNVRFHILIKHYPTPTEISS